MIISAYASFRTYGRFVVSFVVFVATDTWTFFGRPTCYGGAGLSLSTSSFLRASCSLDSLPLEGQGKFGALHHAEEFFGDVYDEDIDET
jgi:hypothetical protein